MIENSTPLSRRLIAARSALLVVDMQNDFCADGGYVSRRGRNVAPCREIVPRLDALICAARKSRIPVLWLVAEYSEDFVPAPMLMKKREAGIQDTCCATGSWGFAPFGVSPEHGDPIVAKHQYSGFYDTDLDSRLRQAGIETLVFAGVQTNICVESTLRDGFARGYQIVVAEDCVASHMPAEHASTLANVRFLFGCVAQGAEIAAAWSCAEPGSKAPGAIEAPNDREKKHGVAV